MLFEEARANAFLLIDAGTDLELGSITEVYPL
jgi:hypothetical protein